MKSLLLFATAAFPLQGASVAVSNYLYTRGPNPSYPDSGGELTNGVIQTTVWGNGNSVSLAQTAPLVGWLNSNPSIRFNFPSGQSIDELTIWMVDSDNAAGVGLPSTVALSTADGLFSQTYNIPNPTGAGVIRPITISNLGLTTDNLIVTATRVNQWTMFSEVTFSDTSTVPEPSSAILALIGCTAILRRKRST